jgi:hypothetical protein
MAIVPRVINFGIHVPDCVELSRLVTRTTRYVADDMNVVPGPATLPIRK